MTGVRELPCPRADVTREDGLAIGFQRVDDYQAPRWPDQAAPQQSHHDFAVDDLDEAEALLLRGARPNRSSTNRVATDGGSSLIRPGIPSA